MKGQNPIHDHLFQSNISSEGKAHPVLIRSHIEDRNISSEVIGRLKGILRTLNGQSIENTRTHLCIPFRVLVCQAPISSAAVHT